MRVRLEPEQARQLERAADGADLDAAAVGLEDARIEALDAHLHLGAPEPAHLGEGLRIDGIGTRLHHQAHHAVGAVLVGGMLALDVVPGGGLPRGGLLPGGALAVQFGEGLVVRDAPAVHALLRLGDAARAALLVARDAQALVPCAPLRRARFGEAGVGGFVERAEQLADEPAPVAGGVVVPGAAQDDELDLVGDVPHLVERAQA